MKRKDRVIGVCTVQQQAVKWVTDIELCKSTGDQRIVQFIVKVHQAVIDLILVRLMPTLSVIRFGGTVIIAEFQEHQCFAKRLIGNLFSFNNLTERDIVRERFCKTFREFYRRFSFTTALIAVAQ